MSLYFTINQDFAIAKSAQSEVIPDFMGQRSSPILKAKYIEWDKTICIKRLKISIN